MPDYIYEIRKSIREVDDSKPLLTNYFFDSVHHWQKAYQKSEAEQIKLHNIIFELKQKNESLLATIEANTPHQSGKLSVRFRMSLKQAGRGRRPAVAIPSHRLMLQIKSRMKLVTR